MLPTRPVDFWTVGDAPDTLINPATGKVYTVAQYVQDFIQYSTVMHQHDPNLLVFRAGYQRILWPRRGANRCGWSTVDGRLPQRRG